MGVALCVGSPSVAFANGVSVAATNNVQQTTVRGTVVDASGEPMIGVTVTVKGSSSGTVTALDGSFSLNCKPTDVLVFSYVGYVNQEVRANANLSRIVLKEDNAILDEVVVIGYGTTTRKSAVGAVDQVREQERIVVLSAVEDLVVHPAPPGGVATPPVEKLVARAPQRVGNECIKPFHSR